MIQTSLLSSFSKKESYECIYLFTLEEAEIVVPDRVVQWSTPWVVFLWRPIKVSLVCGFSPSLCMINSKTPTSLLLQVPQIMTRQHT